MQRTNEVLKFTCLHCYMEYISIGVSVEQVLTCICPKCGGYCELGVLEVFALLTWMEQYFRGEAFHGQE